MVIVCFIGNLIIEHTRFSKFSSKIMGIVLVVSVIIPLIFTFSGNKSSDLHYKEVFSVDSNFINGMNSYKINLIYAGLKRELTENGIEHADISFVTDEVGGNLVLSKVIISLREAEYNKDDMNIHQIKNLVSVACGVDEENVEIYA